LKDDRLYLRHILDEIAFLRRISQGRTFDDLIRDDYFAHAVRSAVEIIGEAAKNVPSEIRSENPEIPWKEMAALRDRVIHGYFQIDYSIVWSVIEQDLPEIEPRVFRLLKKMDERA
jgi:uncharacterized protein with HEPN domain